MSLNITTKTVQDVTTAVRRQFGDESGVQLTDGDIIRWINDGQVEIANKNRILKGRATVSAVAGQPDYTLPEVNIASIESIHYNGIPLEGIQYPEVEHYIESHPTVFTNAGVGTPVMWYEWGGSISFWPTPSDAHSITLLYTRNPDVVYEQGDTLSIPNKYFNALVQYVLSQAYELDEDFEAAQYKGQQFEATLNSQADDERTTANMMYPTINDVVDY